TATIRPKTTKVFLLTGLLPRGSFAHGTVPGAHTSQRALPAARLRPAHLASVSDQVHVQLVGVDGVDEGQHLVVGPLEGGAFREEPEAAADAVDVDVDRDLGD